MAITIVSGRITKITGARSQAPTFNAGDANFNCTPMHVEGTVRIDGDAADVRDDWNIGWVQAEWIETTWADYRGQFDNHGSIFIQRARPPARPSQACRDTSGPVGDIFTDPTDPREFQTIPAGPFPFDIAVESNDPPAESYDLILTNNLTGKPNFLHEAQIEFHFCTVLTVRDPGLRFFHQAHFYWNVHWQYTFRPTAFPAPTDAQWVATPVVGGNGSHHSAAIPGPPTDRRFSGILTVPQVSSCVDLATFETANPNRREFPRWQSVDVRK